MISAFVITRHAVDDPNLRRDLEGVGVAVLGESDGRAFVQEIIRSAADVVICYEKHPDDALFAGVETLGASAPRPVVVFTSDPDADKIERAACSGVHAYVVNGYSPQRLRSVIHVAQARFRRDRLVRDELIEINARFDERKLVDRAKGILMRACQISEDEAFRTLRTAAMQTKQRLGQVAQPVINAALYSDAVNRAGRLRMFSQRVVKLYAAQVGGLDPDATSEAQAAAATQVEETIALLRRSLSRATFGDLIESVANPWTRLKAAMKPPARLERLADVDLHAEDLLEKAERLTGSLEAAGLATTLRVINVAGRQRMLAQKMAKLGLVAALMDPATAGQMRALSDATAAAFRQGLDYLNAAPLTNTAIRVDLDLAETLWRDLRALLVRRPDVDEQRAIVTLSDRLVERVDHLIDLYERSMQVPLA